MLLSSMSERTNFYAQFLTVLLLFIFVLAITYFTTRWIAKIQRGQMSAGANIEIIETQKVSADKYLQIIKVGNKYLLTAIGKNEIHMLCELSPDELELNSHCNQTIDFKAVLDKFKSNNKKED